MTLYFLPFVAFAFGTWFSVKLWKTITKDHKYLTDKELTRYLDIGKTGVTASGIGLALLASGRIVVGSSRYGLVQIAVLGLITTILLGIVYMIIMSRAYQTGTDTQTSGEKK